MKFILSSHRERGCISFYVISRDQIQLRTFRWFKWGMLAGTKQTSAFHPPRSLSRITILLWSGLLLRIDSVYQPGQGLLPSYSHTRFRFVERKGSKKWVKKGRLSDQSRSRLKTYSGEGSFLLPSHKQADTPKFFLRQEVEQNLPSSGLSIVACFLRKKGSPRNSKI